MKQAEAGKGSKQRPSDLNNYRSNYDAIFGKKEKKPIQEEKTQQQK